MSIINKLVNRVEMMLAKAIVKAVNDTDDIQLMKLSILAGETQDGIERLQNYGFSSMPPIGSEAFVAYLNGNRDHGVVIVCDNGEFRPVGLKDGEAVAYSKHGQTFLLDENGDYVFEGGTDYAVAFDSLKRAFNQLKDDVDALVTLYGTLGPPLTGHVHSGVTTGTGSTGPPTGLALKSTADINPAKVAKVRFPS